MVYDLDDNHFVSLAGGTYVPQEQSTTHRYQFVLSVDKILGINGQTTPQLLRFATTDGNYGDNGGAFTISVSPLTAVPVPAAAWLMGSGLMGLLGLARRRASRA
jgi:hypothetical protein